MRAIRILFSVIAFTLALAVLGCEEKGPAEKAGERIDESAEKAGEKMEEAGDEIEEAADEAEKELEDGGG